jgi:hypothetical protein
MDVFLALFKSIEGSVQPGGNDKDVKAVFDSIKVEQSGTRASLVAVIPFDFFKKLLAETPSEVAPQPAPEPPPQPATKATKKKR